MRFPEPGIIETELACTATHRGELMGIPATGKQVHFTIHTRNRFDGETAYHMPPRATVIASPLTPPAASLHRNAITCATSRGSRTRFCG